MRVSRKEGWILAGVFFVRFGRSKTRVGPGTLVRRRGWWRGLRPAQLPERTGPTAEGPSADWIDVRGVGSRRRRQHPSDSRIRGRAPGRLHAVGQVDIDDEATISRIEIPH